MEKRFEKVKLGEQTEKEKEEIARYRSEADIIVDPSQTAISRKVRGQVVYNDLEVALAEAREGGKLFLEPGNYVSRSDDGFPITKTLSIVGCNVSTVVVQSDVFVKHAVLFQGGQTYFKNIKFMGNVEPQKHRFGIIIFLGVDVVIEDCWFFHGKL